MQTNGGAVSLPATSGMTALNLHSDGGVTTYTLPFAFSLYGAAYTSVIGVLAGLSAIRRPELDRLRHAVSMAELLRNVRIAPFWASSTPTADAGDDVYVSTTATSVTFRLGRANANAGDGAVNFSVTLNSNGSFSFNYGAGNAGLDPVIGVSAGNGQVYVLSSAAAAPRSTTPTQQIFTPQPGDIYFDIGAFEFQGNSADTTAADGRFDHPACRPTTARPASPSPA